MYLSRVRIDSNNRQKIKDLNHLGAYHNWVEQSFPRVIKEKAHPRNLWRIDTLKSGKYLIVLSGEKPDFSCFLRYGVEGTVLSRPYDQFLNSLTEGQRLKFRLTANPTHSVIKPGEKRGIVYPHITIIKQKQWLLKKAETSGFKIVENDDEHGIIEKFEKKGFKIVENDDDDQTKFLFDVVSRDHPILIHTVKENKKKKVIRLSRVTFEGFLEITSLDKFKETLIYGVGREKAYGMGLMTVIPAN